MRELSYSLVIETLVMFWHRKCVDVSSQSDSVAALRFVGGHCSFYVYNKTSACALDDVFIFNPKSLQDVNYLLLSSELLKRDLCVLMKVFSQDYELINITAIRLHDLSVL